MRTIEEIKQYYEALREAFRSTNSSDEWVGQPIKEMWMILDHIAELQAQNATLQARVDALGEWQGVEVVPQTENYFDSGYFKSQPLQILLQATGHFSHVPANPINTDTWSYGDEYKVIGWRPIPDEPTATE